MTALTSTPAVRGTVLAVGETMAMVTPIVAESVDTAQHFRVDAGGAESNVASHIAALGGAVRWFSRLGNDALGRRILRQLVARGVDVSTVVLDNEHPTGLYVKDPGRGVSYYRRDSAASRLDRADADGLALDDVAVLHLSGITPALSASADRFLDRLLERAREAGITVSFDVNYRSAIWGLDVAASRLRDLAHAADLVFVGRDEAQTLWATETARDVRSLFPDVAELVIKDGEVGATAFAGDDEVFVPAPEVDVVEVVGAGDAFAGGYLAAVRREAPLADRLISGHDRAARVLLTTADFPEEG